MGVITAKRERVSAALKVLKDEQTLADAEHMAGRDPTRAWSTPSRPAPIGSR